MRRSTRPILLATLPLLLFAGCSQREERGAESLETFDVASEPAMGTEPSAPSAPPPVATSTRDAMSEVAAPGINVTAAPGVAFDYRYAFRLPSPSIGTVQEAHAAMCEKLGLAKCRITGMRYQVRGEDKIAAMLALKLDPAIARDFGKQATALVVGAKGMLVDQEISGIDVGTRIDSATRDKARLEADVDRLEAELRALGVRDPRRGDIAARIEDMRRQLRSLDSTRDSDREALAGTPMLFNYGSGSAIPGFDTSSPIRDAFAQAGGNFVGAIAALILIVTALLPWLLVGGLLLWLWRRFGPRWTAGGYRSEPESAGAPPPAG